MKQRKDLERLENVIGKVKNPPEGQGGTPEIDKYMKMHERPRKQPPTITEKANIAIEGIANMVTIPLTGKSVADWIKYHYPNTAYKQEKKKSWVAKKEGDHSKNQFPKGVMFGTKER